MVGHVQFGAVFAVLAVFGNEFAYLFEILLFFGIVLNVKEDGESGWAEDTLGLQCFLMCPARRRVEKLLKFFLRNGFVKCTYANRQM